VFLLLRLILCPCVRCSCFGGCCCVMMTLVVCDSRATCGCCGTFVTPSMTQDPSEAISRLCEEHILPHLGAAAVHNKNEFRRTRLYNEEVNDILKPKLPVLKEIFITYCKGKPHSRTKYPIMSIEEWCDFLNAVNMIDDDFTKREARLSFTWAKMRNSDEVKNRDRITSMNFMDYLEGLGRVSEMKTIPTEARMAEIALETGKPCSNILEYMELPVEDRPSEDVSDDADYLAVDHLTRPMADRLEKFLVLLLSVFDQEGDGDIKISDIKKHRKLSQT